MAKQDNPYERSLSNRRRGAKQGPRNDILFLKPEQFLNHSLIQQPNQLWSYLEGMQRGVVDNIIKAIEFAKLPTDKVPKLLNQDFRKMIIASFWDID